MKKKVKQLLAKARESALLAVNVYNNPGTVFRSSGFIVLMNIAWTSLFHAIYEKREEKYFYKEPNNRRKYMIIDGEPKAWELAKCAKEYFQGQNDSLYKNILFFIEIRNKIEHRFVPEIDPTIFGECQAYLINFEEILVKEFGDKYALADSLLFALQYSRLRTGEQLEAVKRVQSRYFNEIKGFIDNFRKNLDDAILSDPKFAFRVFLVPKPANHENSSDTVVEFVKYDNQNPEEMKKYDHLVTLIKEKTVIKAPSSSSNVKTDQVIYVDRANQGNSMNPVGITSDPTKAAGVLLLEKLSEDFFNSANGFFDAASILYDKIGEFPLSKKSLIYTYSLAPNSVIKHEVAQIFLEGSYKEYVPYYYWLLNSSPDGIVKFLKNSLAENSYPRVMSIFRLIISIDNQTWINYIKENVMKLFDRYTQKPQWYWSLNNFIEKSKDKKGIYAVTDLQPYHMIGNYKVKDLIDDEKTSEKELSNYCARLAAGIGELSVARNLDLITYLNRLAKLIPDP